MSQNRCLLSQSYLLWQQRQSHVAEVEGAHLVRVALQSIRSTTSLNA